MNGYRHILFPVDRSAHSKRLMARVAQLIGENQARLTLLHVIANFPEDIPNDWIAPENRPPREYMMERCRRELEALAAESGLDDVECVCLVSEHSARHAILEYANAQGADLIVLGAHGHGHGLLGSLLGSVATGVVGSARQDVLILRDHSGE